MAKTPLARVLRRFYRGLLDLRRVLWTVGSFLLSSVISEQKTTAAQVVLPDHLLLFALLLLFGYSLELGLLLFVSRHPQSDEILSDFADEVLNEPDETKETSEHEPDITRIS
jgi:hypothetical protein